MNGWKYFYNNWRDDGMMKGYLKIIAHRISRKITTTADDTTRAAERPNTKTNNRKKKSSCKDAINWTISIAGACTRTLQEEERVEQGRRRTATMWTLKWLTIREESSQYSRLFRNLSLEDEEGYKKWMRWNKSQFRELLELMRSDIAKKGRKYEEGYEIRGVP